MKSLYTILLLIFSNVFMTLAWYGHLHLEKYSWFQKWSLWAIVLFSWGLALFEYLFQVPANRIGSKVTGGPFNLFELKIIQEAITLVVFTVFAVGIFKIEKWTWNYAIGFGFLMLAVYFIFKKP